MFRIQDYQLSQAQESIKGQYRAAGRVVELVPFTYNVNQQPLNVAQTIATPNTTDAEGEFWVMATCQTAINAGTGAYVQYPNIQAQIFWDVSGRQAQDRPTHLLNVFGSAKRPFLWVNPQRIPIKSTWTTTLTNNDAAVNFNVFLAYHGVKAVQTGGR